MSTKFAHEKRSNQAEHRSSKEKNRNRHLWIIFFKVYVIHSHLLHRDFITAIQLHGVAVVHDPSTAIHSHVTFHAEATVFYPQVIRRRCGP
jgi:hypothetical protein